MPSFHLAIYWPGRQKGWGHILYESEKPRVNPRTLQKVRIYPITSQIKGVIYFRSVICFRLGHTCPCIATPTQTGIEERAQTLKLRVQILHLSLNMRPYTNHFVSQNLNFFISKLGLIITTWGASCEDEIYMKPDTYKALTERDLCVLELADSQKAHC